MESMTPARLKRITLTVGAILMVIGIPFAINVLCLVPITLLDSSDSDSTRFGIISALLLLLTLGVGFVAYWHADRSLKKKPSKPLRLPSAIFLAAIFVPLLLLGIIMQLGKVGVLFVPTLIVLATLPPLWALTWMIPQVPADNVENNVDANHGTEQASIDVTSTFLTWRRGLLVFAAGASLSVFIAILLEVLLPLSILALVSNLADTFATSVRSLVRELSNNNVAQAVTNPNFLFIIVHLAIIAPIAEEFAKPLVTLPLLRNVSRQEAFCFGALAGAGFAAVENVLYSAAGISVWAGILIVRALGSALHPLCSGLVAIGWRDVLNQERDAASNWWRRFGIAVAIHAAWNGGSLLVITVGSARLFGEIPAELGVLGISATGTVLAFVLLLGIAALWIGRIYGQNTSFPDTGVSDAPVDSKTAPSDRAMAIWAVICLVAILPIGIAGLKLWLP